MIFSCLFKNILLSQGMKLFNNLFWKDSDSDNVFSYNNVKIRSWHSYLKSFLFFPLENNEYKQPHLSEYFISTFCFGSEHYIALCTTFDVSSQLPFSICYQPTSFLLSITLHFVSRFLTWHLKYPSYTSPGFYTPATSLIRILSPTFYNTFLEILKSLNTFLIHRSSSSGLPISSLHNPDILGWKSLDEEMFSNEYFYSKKNNHPLCDLKFLNKRSKIFPLLNILATVH